MDLEAAKRLIKDIYGGEGPDEWTVDKLEKALMSLSPRRTEILRLYYGLRHGNPLKVKEIAPIFCLSRQRIYQLIKNSLRMLRHPVRQRIIAGQPELTPKNEPPVTLETPINELNLTIRALNCLKGTGVETVAQLCAMRDLEVLSIKNLGRKTFMLDIIPELAEHGLTLQPRATGPNGECEYKVWVNLHPQECSHTSWAPNGTWIFTHHCPHYVLAHSRFEAIQKGEAEHKRICVENEKR